MRKIYFKSFRRRELNSPLETSLFNQESNSLSTCQTLREILNEKILRANTVHNVLPTRLSVSFPTKRFLGLYRPEGLLFTTDEDPSYCVPFDMMALTRGTKFNHEDYGSDFLEGYQRFIFPDFESMIKAFPDSGCAINSLNEFRKSNSLQPITKQMNYNEVCFEKDIEIEPAALMGESFEISNLARNHNLSRYDNLDVYLHPIKYKLLKVLDAGLAYQFEGLQSDWSIPNQNTYEIRRA